MSLFGALLEVGTAGDTRFCRCASVDGNGEAMARLKALCVWVVALSWFDALLGGSNERIWCSFLQVMNIPSTALVGREVSSLSIAGVWAKRATCGMLSVACRGTGDRSMLADGSERPPSQLKALGRSMMTAKFSFVLLSL